MAGVWRILVTLTALVWCANAQAQTAPPPVEAFGRLPAVIDAAISPDGTKVAMAMSRSDGTFLNVIDIDGRRSVFTGALPEDSQLRGVGWAEDGKVSYIVSRTVRPGTVLPFYVRFRGAPGRVDYVRTGVLDLATNRMSLLTTNNEEQWQDTGSYLFAPVTGDPGYARMIGKAPGIETAWPAVFRVSLTNGRSRYLATQGAGEDTFGYLLDETGAVAVRIDSKKETNRWRVFTYDGDRPRLLLEGVSDTGEPVDLQGLLPDGRIAALDEDDAGEFYRLYAIDRASGAKTLLFERPGFEVSGAITDPWTHRVVGVRWIEVERKQQFFEPALQSAYESVSALFESGGVVLSSWSRDRRRIVVKGELGLDGGAYYVFTPADNSLVRLSKIYPELGDAPAGIRQGITYRARDGVRIPAYLTLPEAAEARNLPLVVLVHGGPTARDTLDFDWWASFLASRGYAVLQPNYRGSSGYGSTWEHAGRGQWGGLMQTDVDDGAAALVRNGIADASRICIVGASYGGYAALAGATLTPDRYKCAASIAGVSDLVEFLRQREERTGEESMAADFWRLSIGDHHEDRNAIRDVSPANLAARVQIPILLIHGTDDTVVPIAQSRRMLDRLRDAGKDVRFVELSGDDHWLSDAATRTQMLRELETFLAANLGAAP
jgi:dipeptidyl aminopeptidase/acylaminoacyl peptidase